MTWHCRLYLM